MSAEFGDLVRKHLDAVDKRNAEALTDVADLLLACIRADGLILSGGAGHSLAAVAETFYRAGGLACVRPLYHPDLLPMHGAMTSTSTEREQGLAARVLQEVPLSGHDVVVVFSTSGVNPYPVELAVTGRAIGCPVIAVTSGPASAAAPPRSAAGTLAENATIVLDTLVPPGDSVYPPAAPHTAALSTVVNAYLWNQVLAKLSQTAAVSHQQLPLWRSSNVPGGDEANAGLLAKYGPRVPQLS